MTHDDEQSASAYDPGPSAGPDPVGRPCVRRNGCSFNRVVVAGRRNPGTKRGLLEGGPASRDRCLRLPRAERTEGVRHGHGSGASEERQPSHRVLRGESQHFLHGWTAEFLREGEIDRPIQDERTRAALRRHAAEYLRDERIEEEADPANAGPGYLALHYRLQRAATLVTAVVVGPDKRRG